MSQVRPPYRDFDELVDHLKALTEELTALHSDLYWLAMQAEEASGEPPAAAELNVDLLASLKGAVDNMRMLLWKYIETASEVNPQKAAEGLETQRLQRVTRFLELLRVRLGSSSDQQPLSFIERISAAMKERFRDKVA